MNRALLSKVLRRMKTNILEGKSIGELKIGAILALGHQLEAIVYYLGHELGTLFDIPEISDLTKIPEELSKLVKELHLGDVEISEKSADHASFKLKSCRSCKELQPLDIKTDESFCSFEAGLLAAFVEKMTKSHCFAQELNCSLQTGDPYCEFMIVYQKD